MQDERTPSPEQEDTLRGFVRQLARYGDAPAIIAVEAEAVATVSYAELATRSSDVAAGLLARGVGNGEPVPIVAPNGVAWIATFLGILAAGAAAMPLDVRLGAAEREEALHAVERAPADTALLLRTSGTTGPPKIVPLSHANVLANLRALVAERLVDRNVRALLPLPLHHIYPLVVGLLLPLSVGGSVVLPAGISGPELNRALAVSRADTMVGVPRLYDALRDAIVQRVHRGHPAAATLFDRTLDVSVAGVRRGHLTFGRRVFAPLRQAVAPALVRLACGGAALDPGTEEVLLALGYEVIVGYGLTETAPLVAFNRPGRIRLASAGEPLPGVAVRIAGPDADGLGEIEVRGPNVFAGYYGDDAATRAAFRSDGWFRTGDRGRLDADGFLFVRGRSGELLVLPGGEKLDPEQLEAAYASSPAIAEIAVLLDEGKLVALVIPAGDVRAALRERGNALPRYMQLAGYAVADEPLPRTPIGKLQRHRLPALYRAARRRAAERRAHGAEMTPADRALVADPDVQRTWTWLQRHFAPTSLSLDMSLQLDLGLDSLAWVALTLELEHDLGTSLDEAALGLVVTVRDLLLAVQAAPEARLAERAVDALAHPHRWEEAVWCVGQHAERCLMQAFFRVRAVGTEHLPQRGPFVLCPNHASYLDPPVLAAALPWPILEHVVWAGAVDVMFSSAPKRLFSRLAHVVPIDTVRGARAGLRASTRVLLELQRILVWFPEGWRTEDGQLRPFLPGIGELALRAGMPIVPVSIGGTFAAWPPQRRFPRPHPVRVRFGAPLMPERWDSLRDRGDAAALIAAEVKAAVAALQAD